MFAVLTSVLCFGLVSADYGVTLEEVSTVFLPTGTRKWDVPVAEKANYNSKKKLLYVVGGRYRHIVDYKVPASPSILEVYKNSVEDSETTDISVCGDYFIQTIDNTKEKSRGVVEIFKHLGTSNTTERVYRREVGEDPDSVRFLPGCKEAVVTVRGTAFQSNGNFRDPKGKVIFVQLPAAGAPGSFQENVKFTTLDFTKFDSKVADLLKDGARHVYTANGNLFSNDVDPITMTVSPDGKKVFISLQVTNAVAVVDVPTKSITQVHGLGMKEWQNLTMDASDMDDGINMKRWPIYSYYLPDGIGFMRHNKRDYIVTANEGNDYDYSDYVNFKEEKRGKDFVNDNLIAPSVSAQMKAWLADDKALGRLLFTTENGEGNKTAYTKFVAFGGRSFSIWDAKTMDQVYDSGDDLAKQHAKLNPDLFNGDVEDDSTPMEDADTSSDKRGLEPESIAIGALGRLGLIFVGAESSATVSIYSVLDDIRKPRFESMWQGVSNTRTKWKTMYESKTLKGVDPEFLSFLDENESPTGKPALIMIGAVSNSITLFNVKLTGTVPAPPASSSNDLKIDFILLTILAVLCHLV